MNPTSKSIYSRARSDEKHHRLDITIQEEAPGLRMKIDAEMNEVGVLFRLCAVLYSYGWNIRSARIHSPDEKRISDEFHIIPGEDPAVMDEESVRNLIDDLERLLFAGVSVLEFLTERQARVPRYSQEAAGGKVSLKTGPKKRTYIEVTGPDQRGLLLSLSQAFYLMDINIFEAEIETTKEGGIRNTFYVDPGDARFQSPEFQRRLCEELQMLY